MTFIMLSAWILIGILGIAFAQWHLIGGFLVIGSIGYALALKGGRPFTEGNLYIASRLPKTNFLFPTQVAIQPTRVIRYKARVFGHDEESIALAQIASVKIQTRLLWSDVIIESTGGSNSIICHGHTNRDAVAMKAAIERYQQEYFEGRSDTLRVQAPTSPHDDTGAAWPTLLLSVYPVPPKGSDSFHRWPTPLKQLRINSHEHTTAQLLELLREGGPGSYVHVEALDQ